MKVSLDVQEIIIKLRIQGKSLIDISKVVNKRLSNIQYIIKRYWELGTVQNRH